MTDADTPDLLTVAEVAEALRLNQQTVRNWIDRGELHAIRVGPRRIRIPAPELDRFIAKSSAAAIPNEREARDRFTRALRAVEETDGAELRSALRRLAKAATELARALPRA